MGKRFQRHRPFDCLRFLYPHILHSKRSDPLAALALSKQALRVRATPLLHQVACAAKTGFASRFVEPVHTPRQSGGRTGRRLMQPEYSVASRNSIRRRWNHNKRPFTSDQGPGGILFHNLLTNCARLTKKMWIEKPQAIRRAEPLCFWRPAFVIFL